MYKEVLENNWLGLYKKTSGGFAPIDLGSRFFFALTSQTYVTLGIYF